MTTAGPQGDFRAHANVALANARLRGALERATDLFRERRGLAVSEVSDWEALRDEASDLKKHTLAHLDHYLGAFIDRAEGHGAKVSFARDAAEACAVVEAILRDEALPTIVKSKSMTTEEIGLNEHLERLGYAPVETDLGEWIIQLAHEKPSHIIVPAIHKTKGEISELFTEKLGVPRTDDEEELAAHARSRLRSAFAEARVGITGVNFAVAETGSLLILENEGNIRMSTTLPRVHIAIVGIEKVVPRLQDLGLFLGLLPRSGTGQRLTTYQSLITGPAGPSDLDADGKPSRLFIVLLDNGRTEMLRDEVLRETLACIRCGACLNACPVYREVGGHAYGAVYPGPIGAIVTPQLGRPAGARPGASHVHGNTHAHALPFASSLCAACRDVCPVKIDIPKILLHLRARSVQRADTVREEISRRLGALVSWGFVVAMQHAFTFRLFWAVLRGLLRLARLGPAARLGVRPAWVSAPGAGRSRSFRAAWRARERRGRVPSP